MDPISQGAAGAILPQAFASVEKTRVYVLLGALAGMAPDLDVLIRSSNDPLLFLEYHRQFTHALLFVPIGAGICAIGLFGFVRHRLSLIEVYVVCFMGYLTHGLLDACTSYGTQLFWPFSTARIAWNNVSVIDPLFTVPLVTLLIIGTVRKQRIFAIAGLFWAIFYLIIGIVQRERVMDAAEAMAVTRGYEVEGLDVKPAFANLLLWKVVYDSGERFFVDSIRAGVSTQICEGESVSKLNVLRDLPWLETSSQQHRDLERFRWFSNDFLALDSANDNFVIDIRYSTLPNRIDALWGVQLNPNAADNNHAEFRVMQSRRSQALPELWQMILGNGCISE